MEDIVTNVITSEDSDWIYGTKFRNGQFATHWVRLKDEALRRIGFENNCKRLGIDVEEYRKAFQK